MDSCIDEGYWSGLNGCPCFDGEMGICQITQKYEKRDTCPYAPILKLLAEAKEISDCDLSPFINIYGWEFVSFWIRRER